MSMRLLPLFAILVLLPPMRTGPAEAAGRCDVETLIPILRQMNHPMTFRRVLTRPHRQTEVALFDNKTEIGILAEGGIEADTAEDFRRFVQANPLPPGTAVYLSSGGGNVLGGLKLGQLIRERRFDTVIGRFDETAMSEIPGADLTKPTVFGPHSIRASACMSACTFAFLGGIDRRVHASDLYGVHRMYNDKVTDPGQAMAIAQILTAEVLSYVRSMGADPGLIEDMVKEGKTSVLGLSMERLVGLRVVTTSQMASVGQADELSCGNAGMTQKDLDELWESIDRDMKRTKTPPLTPEQCKLMPGCMIVPLTR
jgi:hypothetical protein